MKKFIFTALAAAAFCFNAGAQDIQVHGFIRNFYAFDTRECVSGTEDFFVYLPKDVSLNTEGDDLNAHNSFRYAALTSRLWVEAKGYKVNDWNLGARIEADFYNGLSSSSSDPVTKTALTGAANFRLRQAFVTVSNGTWNFKAGQAWHPMAADMPDVFSLNTGAPFGPFSRTPLFSVDYNVSSSLSVTAASIWQQQYTSAGPYGASANYVRNGGGELYLGLNYKNGGFLGRVGVDVLSITPRLVNDAKLKVDEKLTTKTPFVYVQYVKGNSSIKVKAAYAEAGEHMSLNGGYAVHGIKEDGRSYIYTPTRNFSTWASFMQKVGNWQLILFGGYAKNFGTKDSVLGTIMTPTGFYFSKNSFVQMNSMYRATPTVIYNFGKLQLGLEYEMTSVVYGDTSKGINLETGLYDQGLHNITNNRVQGLVKFTF